ncbi:glycosyltransferase [uncultured Desulfobacter sp.]|uniref:glycosyltransferase n=1 Tax=uncultured Desulfobacter sp. TaxID=240139 RepID=UPI003747A26D
MNNVSIIIPFYNEENIVLQVLEEVCVCQPCSEIIAVDDGREMTDYLIAFNGVYRYLGAFFREPATALSKFPQITAQDLAERPNTPIWEGPSGESMI